MGTNIVQKQILFWESLRPTPPTLGPKPSWSSFEVFFNDDETPTRIKILENLSGGLNDQLINIKIENDVDFNEIKKNVDGRQINFRQYDVHGYNNEKWFQSSGRNYIWEKITRIGDDEKFEQVLMINPDKTKLIFKDNYSNYSKEKKKFTNKTYAYNIEKTTPTSAGGKSYRKRKYHKRRQRRVTKKRSKCRQRRITKQRSKCRRHQVNTQRRAYKR
jgi:hypothetical protein